MTAEQQQEVDYAFLEVKSQRIKDYARGRYWIGGMMYYLEGAKDAPKDGHYLIHPPKLAWI